MSEYSFKFDLANRDSSEEDKTFIKILACSYVDEHKGEIEDKQKFFKLAVELIHNGFLAATLIAEQSEGWRKAFNAYLRNFEKGYQEYKKATLGFEVPASTEFKA